MKKLATCSYPPVILDEATGVEVSNDAFQYWCEGRNAQFCMEDEVSPEEKEVSPDLAKRIKRAREDGQALRAFQEGLESKVDWRASFKRAVTECALNPREPLTIDPKNISEGACHIMRWQGKKICVAKEHGKLKMFEVVEEE